MKGYQWLSLTQPKLKANDTTVLLHAIGRMQQHGMHRITELESLKEPYGCSSPALCWRKKATTQTLLGDGDSTILLKCPSRRYPLPSQIAHGLHTNVGTCNMYAWHVLRKCENSPNGSRKKAHHNYHKYFSARLGMHRRGNAERDVLSRHCWLMKIFVRGFYVENIQK